MVHNIKKFDVILAVTENKDKNRDTRYGVGLMQRLTGSEMPWSCKEELKIFREKTMNSILIMGRKTVESIPSLSGRIIYCITRSGVVKPPLNTQIICCNSINGAMRHAERYYPNKKVFIAGGAGIYNEIFNNKKYKKRIDTLHISIMKNVYHCDIFIEFSPEDLYNGWAIKNIDEYNEFVHYTMIWQPQEIQFITLLKQVREFGKKQMTRNAITQSLFKKDVSFDLTYGFPLLTTKKMFFRGIVEELLFFLKGETDTKILEEKNIHIWKGNTSREFLDSINMTTRREGLMGPMYGSVWRHFNGDYDEKTGLSSNGIDQLKYIVDTIRINPASRRILMTDFNPSVALAGVLFPCHSLILQFHVENDEEGKIGFLDMFCFNRSSDLFLGLPFNIASSALLLTIIAKLTNLIPRRLDITLGDAHIYESHLEMVEEQISRLPFKMPQVLINKDLNTLEDVTALCYDDFSLIGYKSHSKISAKMIS